MLIKEITRRVNLEGIFQAVYTAGVLLPKPIAVCRLVHSALCCLYVSYKINMHLSLEDMLYKPNIVSVHVYYYMYIVCFLG